MGQCLILIVAIKLISFQQLMIVEHVVKGPGSAVVELVVLLRHGHRDFHVDQVVAVHDVLRRRFNKRPQFENL